MPHKLEFRRKTIHIFTGILVIILISKGILNIPVLIVALVIGLLLSLASIKHRLPLIGWCLDKFDRPGEKFPGKGAVNYLLGIFLLILLFSGGDNHIVYASILILALGDSFTALIGIRLKSTTRLKKTRIPMSTGKLLEATVFGMIIASLGAMLFVSVLEAVLASAVAMTLEALELRFGREPIDDNIIIPLAAAITMFIIRIYI